MSDTIVDPDFYLPRVMFLIAIVAFMVMVILALIGNATVLATNLVDVRRLPHFRINMNQLANGVPCMANVMSGTFAVGWFTYIAIAGVQSLEHAGAACHIVSTLLVWTSVAYLMGLLMMSIDRMMAARRHGMYLGDRFHRRSIHMTMVGVWLSVAGCFLYASSVSIALTTSRRMEISMKMLCFTRVDDGCFWIVSVGYLLPCIVIIGCLMSATFMTFRRELLVTEDDDQIVAGVLKEQRRMLKFLSSLVMCWIIGNVLPLLYALRGSQSLSMEVLLVLLILGHQFVLPVATFICERRLWSRVRRFLGVVGDSNPRTVNRRGGTPTDHDSDGDADIEDDEEHASAGPSSRTAGDGPFEMETRTTQDGDSHKRAKTDGDAVERLDDVNDGPNASQRLFSMHHRINSTGHCNSSRVMDDTPNCGDVTGEPSAAADVEACSDITTSKSDVDDGPSSKSADENLPDNLDDQTPDQSTTQHQKEMEMGDATADPGPDSLAIDMEIKEHPVYEECGLGDATKNPTSMYAYCDDEEETASEKSEK